MSKGRNGMEPETGAKTWMFLWLVSTNHFTTLPNHASWGSHNPRGPESQLSFQDFLSYLFVSNHLPVPVLPYLGFVANACCVAGTQHLWILTQCSQPFLISDPSEGTMNRDSSSSSLPSTGKCIFCSTQTNTALS